MAENNPYSGLFSFEDKKESSAPSPAPSASVSQKEKDVDAAAIIQKEFEKSVTRLAELHGKTPSAKPEDAAALQEDIRRTKEDIASEQRELKRFGVDVSAPDFKGSAASGNPYRDLFNLGGEPSPGEASLDPFLALSGVGGAFVGGAFGARKKPSADSLAAMQLEKQYGLPPGSLAMMESIQNPKAALPSGEAARLTAEHFNPPAAPIGEIASLTPEAPLSSMEKWTHSQTGEESRLPSSVISQFTSNMAADPSGAPQGILREAANTRKARALAPTTEVTSGGLHVVESPKDRQARLVAAANNQRQAAIDAALNAPIVPRATDTERRQQQITAMQKPIERAALQARGLQRGANTAQGGLFGLGTGLQAYNMVSDAQQGNSPDWTQWLSLLGNLGGMVGPATTRIPAVGRVPVVGPLATLAQIPYAVKHRDEIARGMTMADVMPDAMRTMLGVGTGEGGEPAFPDLR